MDHFTAAANKPLLLFLTLFAAIAASHAVTQAAENQSSSDAIVQASGISGGLCVQVGCDDLTVAGGLARTGRFLVQLVDDDRVLGEVVNLGAGADYSIGQFAREICRQTGVPETLVEYDTSKYVGAPSKSLDAAKVLELISWAPRGMDECVADVIRAVRP